MEITLNLKADPAITDAINNLAEAIRGHQGGTTTVAVPQRLLETPIPKTMQETVTATSGKKRGRPSKDKEPEPEPEPAPPENAPKIEVVSGLPADLPNYDKLRTRCRQLITEGMNRDMVAGNKVNREKAKEIINTIHPGADGKISQVPNELLPSVLSLLEEALTNL